MSYEKDKVRNVYAHYGDRTSGGGIGQEESINSVRRFTVGLNDVSIGKAPYVAPVVIPKGAKMVKATLFVHSASNIASNATVTVGDSSNGIVITEAMLKAEGTKNVSTAATGTWATSSDTGLTADQFIKVVNSDNTTKKFTGDATLVMEFEYK